MFAAMKPLRDALKKVKIEKPGDLSGLPFLSPDCRDFECDLCTDNYCDCQCHETNDNTSVQGQG